MIFRLLLVPLFVLILLSACSEKSADDVQENEAVSPMKLPLYRVESRVLDHDLQMQGVVGPLPDHSVKVSSAIAGKIKAVYVVEGQRVKKGELLAKLDDAHIQQQLLQSNASCQAAEVVLTQAKSALKFAKENLERQNQLFQAEVAAKKDLIAAQNQVQTSELQIPSAEAQLNAAKASREQIKTELALTELHAPIDGVVAARFLNMGDSSDPANPIVQIVGLESVAVKGYLPADSPEPLKVGEQASIWSESEPGVRYAAVIKFISELVDRSNNTIAVQLECKNPNAKLRDGQSVHVVVASHLSKTYPVIPTSAIVPDPDNPDRKMVYVVDDGKAHRVNVSIGTVNDNIAEILDGLKPGTQILKEGAYGLPDGSPIASTKGQN